MRSGGENSSDISHSMCLRQKMMNHMGFVSGAKCMFKVENDSSIIYLDVVWLDE